MLNSKKFYYDNDTFQYLPVKTTLRVIGIKAAVFISFTLVLMVCTRSLWLPLETYFIKDEPQRILQKLKKQNSDMVAIGKALDKIHYNDQNFYKSILNIKPIDAAVWDAGTGGSEELNKIELPILREILIRANKLSHKIELQSESFESVKKLAIAKSEELKHMPVARPLDGRIVSGFGYRNDPFYGHIHFHAGLDIVAQIGTPIRAVGDATVITSGYTEQGYGLQIELNHGFGFVTKYAHLSQSAVKIGQKVKRGDLIGYTGNSGYSTGPHLHYEIIKHGIKVNPLDFYYNE